MEWPEDWDARVAGDSCALCAEGRPDDTGRAIRFHETAIVDAYLPRSGVQPGYAIVVWRGGHVVEPTELSERDAAAYWREVLAVGSAMERHYAPRKMNYQTLGNAMPHLHTIVSTRRVHDDVAPRRPLPADGGYDFDEQEVQADAAALRLLLSHPESPAFPTKRVGAGVVIRNAANEVLLVEPTYKPRWEIPGGLVEPGESPREAAAREAREELGLVIEIGALLAVHYNDSGRHPTDGVMFVFDGGRLDEVSRLVLPPDELLSAEFVALDRLGDRVDPKMVARLQAAMSALADGIPRYLER